MRRVILLCIALAFAETLVNAQSGLTYRFRDDTLVGTMWLAGDDARRELESGEDGLAAGRVEIWRNGGSEIFILDPRSSTYYEQNAYLQRRDVPRASLHTLTVSRPFSVRGVTDVRVDLDLKSGSHTISGYRCRRGILTFSYNLDLLIDRVNVRVPGRVEGSQDFCIMVAPDAPPLPFGHALAFTSGHAAVDAAVAARLSALKGILLARTLTATRRIERGEAVSATSILLVSDVQRVDIGPDRFEVPKDYRFQDPQLVPPVRKRP